MPASSSLRKVSRAWTFAALFTMIRPASSKTPPPAHGANTLVITSGRRGAPPLLGEADPSRMSDPLPQALALTAIVITFAVTALLLALAYRSWLLTHDDEVEDDVGDRSIAGGIARDQELVDQQLAMDLDDDAPSPPDEVPHR